MLLLATKLLVPLLFWRENLFLPLLFDHVHSAFECTWSKCIKANRKGAKEAQELFDTAHENRCLAEENRNLKLQLQKEKETQMLREESTPPT
jgi:hypothetical protein